MKKIVAIIIVSILISFALFITYCPKCSHASNEQICNPLPTAQCEIFQGENFQSVQKMINEWLIKNKKINIIAVGQSECYDDSSMRKPPIRAVITIFYKKYDSEL